MYLGKPLFAQVMDFLPWKTFHRIVDRYGGDHRTRSLSCAEQFRVMAFAQLTYRESLRDIEVCLAAQAGKLYHMGIGAAVASSTLASAWNWPIPCMPSMPRPSICACRCSRGRHSAPPRRP